MAEHIVGNPESEVSPISATERPPASGEHIEALPVSKVDANLLDVGHQIVGEGRAVTNSQITLASGIFRNNLPTMDAKQIQAGLIEVEPRIIPTTNIAYHALSDDEQAEINKRLSQLTPNTSAFSKAYQWYYDLIMGWSFKKRFAAIMGFLAGGFISTAPVFLLLQTEPVIAKVQPVDNGAKAAPSSQEPIKPEKSSSTQIKTLTLNSQECDQMKMFYDQLLKDKTISEEDLRNFSGLFPKPSQFPYGEKMTAYTNRRPSNFLFLNGPTGGVNRSDSNGRVNTLPKYNWISINKLGSGLAKAYRDTQIIVAKVSDNKTIRLEDIIVKIGDGNYMNAKQLSETDKQRISINIVNGVAVIVLLDYAHGNKIADNAVTLYVNKDQVQITEMTKAGLSKLPMVDLAFTGDSNK